MKQYPAPGAEPYKARRLFLPYLLLTLTVLFWSGNFVLGRGVREIIPPVSLNFWRWFGALLILMPFGIPRIRKQRQLLRKHWRFLALMSIPSVAIFNAFIYTALKSTTAVNTVLVNAVTPVFIAVGGWLVFGDRMSLRQSAGVFISLTGLVFIITKGDFSVLRSLEFSTGDLWTLGAGFSWAIYSIMLRRKPADMDPIAFLTLIVAFGLIFLMPFYVWEFFSKGGFELSSASLAGISYVCVFPSVLSYIFWNRAVNQVGANRSGVFFHLMPVFSILLAFILLGEHPRLFHLTGMFLIFTGIALTTLPGSAFRTK